MTLQVLQDAALSGFLKPLNIVLFERRSMVKLWRTLQWYYESKVKEQNLYTFLHLSVRKICAALVNRDAYNECAAETHNAYLRLFDSVLFGSIREDSERAEVFDAVKMWKRLYETEDAR